MIPANGVKNGDRYMINEVVAFGCEPGYTLQVPGRWMSSRIHLYVANGFINVFMLISRLYTLCIYLLAQLLLNDIF